MYYKVLLLISIGTVYRYCRSIAQVHACERPTGYIKYESLFRMTLQEVTQLTAFCAWKIHSRARRSELPAAEISGQGNGSARAGNPFRPFCGGLEYLAYDTGHI